MTADELRSGLFLVASPTLRDPNFARTVVLLCEHEDDEGSMGVVVNRPSDLKLSQTLTDIRPGVDQPLFWGGPVQRDIVLVLHRGDLEIPESRPICDGMALGGDQEALLEIVRDPALGAGQVRVYSGYAGWGAGQLAGEMSAKSWITCAAQARFVFDLDPSEVWAEVLRSMGPRYAYLAAVPLDPRVN